ncbi:MAG TPA: folylpolyglutamate synthase/dihydrofolate synthase family protein [Terriglobia bacterium]|nr:folylpolyglutamate synthase/dihydrofolate synthase family protein [Terriglobia bacterium]
MNYTECLAYLNDLGHELRGVKFDLEAIRRITEALGHPEQRYPTAIVAGTNGKGSTSAMLASVLDCAGYRTGLYTSPHLVSVNERIRVAGRAVSDEEFASAFTEVRDAVDRLVATGVLPHLPSFFEFLTATAFLRFAAARVDFVVLEVGMGGRLDATNLTEPRVAVITNVELDHTEFLGATHAAIAFEKAGVIKPGRPVISSCENPVAAEVIRRRAAELGAELIDLPSYVAPGNLRDQAGRYAFDLALNGDRFPNLALPLAGKFQVKNAQAAVAAAWRLAREGFHIPAEAIRAGVHETHWPGRLEIVGRRPLVLLDGAHNPAAAFEIARFIREELADKRLTLVYASMRDKAIGEISEILFPLAAEVYLTRVEQARAALPEEILAAARHTPARVVLEPHPVRALERARQHAAPDDVVLVAGSLFLVGAIKQALEQPASK